jgi:outer membrane lipoprotein-sorting protein
MMKRLFFGIAVLTYALSVDAQEVNDFLKSVRNKLNTVKDYHAEGTMKLDVPFLQVPDSRVTVYYKQPDKFSIKQQKGVSLVPKGGISINMSSLLTKGQFTAVDAGQSPFENKMLRVVKLLPLDENSEVVLTTLYIDAALLLIRKATITTKENGTYQVRFNYGKYSNWGLPDEVLFTFNTKDYKVPKGVTFDYDEEEKIEIDKVKNAKGTVKITYSSYTINKGVSDNVFKKSDTK